MYDNIFIVERKIIKNEKYLKSLFFGFKGGFKLNNSKFFFGGSSMLNIFSKLFSLAKSMGVFLAKF